MKNDQKIRDNGLSKSDYIVWTRMQSEAGQNLSDIVDRKEREREAGKGIFFWGVGNAPSKMINALARTKVDISVVFSRMKSPPKDVDQKPATIVLWKNFIDCEGRLRPNLAESVYTMPFNASARSLSKLQRTVKRLTH